MYEAESLCKNNKDAWVRKIVILVVVYSKEAELLLLLRYIVPGQSFIIIIIAFLVMSYVYPILTLWK